MRENDFIKILKNKSGIFSLLRGARHGVVVLLHTNSTFICVYSVCVYIYTPISKLTNVFLKTLNLSYVDLVSKMSDPKYAYPYPAQGYYQGPPPPVMAPPQYAAPPPQRQAGFLEGCLAALCCCCLLDECCCDPSIIFIS